jgi:nucleoside phosphorylase
MLNKFVQEAGELRLVEIWTNGECVYERVPITTKQSPGIEDVTEDTVQRHLGHTDILIVTATRIELETVISFLKPFPGHECVLRGSVNNITFRLGCFGRYNAAHIQCAMGSQDRHGSALATKEALDLVKPRAVFVIGIAFGIDRRKQRLGDVLIAETICPYELQKIDDTHVVHRGKDMLCGHVLSDRFANLYHDWKMERMSGELVNVHFGLVLSGEKVVASKSFRDSLVREYPTAIGGEMEGAGAYAAVQTDKTEIVLIKGICDWADGSKNDCAQPFAAYTATSLAEYVLHKPDVLKVLRAQDRANVVYCEACTVTIPSKDVSLQEPETLSRTTAWSRLINFL